MAQFVNGKEETQQMIIVLVATQVQKEEKEE